MSREISVSRISENDLEEFSILLQELVEPGSPLEKLRETFKQIDSSESYVLLGARCDGTLAGSLMGIICCDPAGLCRPFMVLENVIVSENYRGHGIAARLMIEIEKKARAADCNYIILVSDTRRETARLLYKSAGYDCDSVRGFKKFL